MTTPRAPLQPLGLDHIVVHVRQGHGVSRVLLRGRRTPRAVLRLGPGPHVGETGVRAGQRHQVLRRVLVVKHHFLEEADAGVSGAAGDFEDQDADSGIIIVPLALRVSAPVPEGRAQPRGGDVGDAVGIPVRPDVAQTAVFEIAIVGIDAPREDIVEIHVRNPRHDHCRIPDFFGLAQGVDTEINHGGLQKLGTVHMLAASMS